MFVVMRPDGKLLPGVTYKKSGKYHPRQWVVRSDPFYGKSAGPLFWNPTDGRSCERNRKATDLHGSTRIRS